MADFKRDFHFMIAARTRVSGLCLYSRTIFLRVKPTGEWWGHPFSMALSVPQEEQQLKERKKPTKAEKKEKGQSEFGEDIWSHWCHILSDRTGVICRPCSRFDAFVYHCDDECVQFFIIDNCQALCNTNLHTKYNKLGVRVMLMIVWLQAISFHIICYV